jgi:acetolactate synthase-1/2/3 large subunit
VAIATPITKWAHHVTCIEHIPRLVAQAIRIATQAPRGPVMLDLPWDILMATVEEGGLIETGTADLRASRAADPDLERIADMLAEAERPVVILGSEARRDGAKSAVERLAAATGVPILAEFEAVGLLRDLPDVLNAGLVQGLYGLKGDAPDLVVMAGLRFGLYTALDSGGLVPHGSRVVQIDPDAREIGRLQAVSLGIVADVGPTLEALAAVAEGRSWPSRSSWQAALAGHVKARYDVVSSHMRERPGMLHPLRASAIVADYVGRDTTLVADGALTYLWMSEVIAQARPEGLLFHSHLSSMGCGFGIAVGAQAGVGDAKRVLLVTGDGAVGYSLAEFDTAVRNELPVIVIVMNNHSWGATQHFQEMVVGSDRVTGTRLENGRYEAVAAAFGGGSYFADSAESLRQALSDALSKDLPACINVLVDLDPIPPEELVVMGMDPFTEPSEHSFRA